MREVKLSRLPLCKLSLIVAWTSPRTVTNLLDRYDELMAITLTAGR
jgi:hypothetical protein